MAFWALNNHRNFGRWAGLDAKFSLKNAGITTEILVVEHDFRAVHRSASCRSRRELSNAYLLAKVGVSTAENEPSKVCPIEQRCSWESEGGRSRRYRRQFSQWNTPWTAGRRTNKLTNLLIYYGNVRTSWREVETAHRTVLSGAPGRWRLPRTPNARLGCKKQRAEQRAEQPFYFFFLFQFLTFLLSFFLLLLLSSFFRICSPTSIKTVTLLYQNGNPFSLW